MRILPKRIKFPTISKRTKFVLNSIFLSAGFVGINFLPDEYRLGAIGALTLLTVLAFVWALWEGLGKNATLFTLILPALFTLGVGLFWFLLPSTIFARLPVVMLYGLGIYALGLTSNIYTVAAVRTIALMRAAKGVGFVLSLLVAFLIFDAILSTRVNVLVNFLLIFIGSFLIFLQGVWVGRGKKEVAQEILVKSLVFGLGIGEMGLLLYFWPVTVVVGSLFLTIGVYVLLGLGQADEEGRLFAQTIREYLFVGLIVFLAMFFATRWSG